MALNQKYTWADFLREHPEHKAKKTQRTSPEGAKAFEAAYQKFIKDYLKQRGERIEGEQKRAAARAAALAAKRAELVKAKKWPKAKIVQRRIGRQDAQLGRLAKQAARTKDLQKNF